jgi:hypothetical protein
MPSARVYDLSSSLEYTMSANTEAHTPRGQGTCSSAMRDGTQYIPIIAGVDERLKSGTTRRTHLQLSDCDISRDPDLSSRWYQGDIRSTYEISHSCTSPRATVAILVSQNSM